MVDQQSANKCRKRTRQQIPSSLASAEGLRSCVCIANAVFELFYGIPALTPMFMETNFQSFHNLLYIQKLGKSKDNVIGLDLLCALLSSVIRISESTVINPWSKESNVSPFFFISV